jgi:hypothetical protein
LITAIYLAEFNSIIQRFSRELTALLPWFIAPAFAAEAATLVVERTVELRRAAVQ